jgi:type VI secretion system protein ImpK
MQHHLVVQECFNSIVRLREAKDDLPCACDVHALLTGALQRMLGAPAALGLAAQDVQDIAFAIVALADEVAMRSGENVADMWQDQKLQTHFFFDHGAGDLFYERLAVLRQNGQGRKAVLFAYYTALALGFEGRLGDAGGRSEIVQLTLELRRMLEGPKQASEYDLSPHALCKRPDQAAPGRRLQPATVWLLFFVVFGGTLWLGLQTVVRARLQQVVELAQMRGTQVALTLEGSPRIQEEDTP